MTAQSPVNFSGKWEYNKSKSSPGTNNANYPGIIVRQITQTAATIAYNDLFIRPGQKDWKSSDELFNLDGKVQVIKTSTETMKKSTKWSPDKSTLTLTYITVYDQDGVTKELMVEEAHKLSDGGKTLTITQLFKNTDTGETRKTNVYRKK